MHLISVINTENKSKQVYRLIHSINMKKVVVIIFQCLFFCTLCVSVRVCFQKYLTFQWMDSVSAKKQKKNSYIYTLKIRRRRRDIVPKDKGSICNTIRVKPRYSLF